MVAIQNEIDEFKNNSKLNFLVVVLGIINHWTALVIKKDSTKMNLKYEYFFLESLGMEPFKFSNAEEVRNYIEDFDMKNKSIGIKGMEKFYKDMFFMWFHDCKEVLELFVLLMITNYDVKEFYLENNIARLVNTVLDAKIGHETVEDSGKLLKLLFDKLQPIVIREETLGLIEKFDFDIKKIKAYNAGLYKKLWVLFEENGKMYKNFDKHRNQIKDENYSHWTLLEHFNIIETMKGLFTSCE